MFCIDDISKIHIAFKTSGKSSNVSSCRSQVLQWNKKKSIYRMLCRNLSLQAYSKSQKTPFNFPCLTTDTNLKQAIKLKPIVLLTFVIEICKQDRKNLDERRTTVFTLIFHENERDSFKCEVLLYKFPTFGSIMQFSKRVNK